MRLLCLLRKEPTDLTVSCRVVVDRVSLAQSHTLRKFAVRKTMSHSRHWQALAKLASVSLDGRSKVRKPAETFEGVSSKAD